MPLAQKKSSVFPFFILSAFLQDRASSFSFSDRGAFFRLPFLPEFSGCCCRRAMLEVAVKVSTVHSNNRKEKPIVRLGIYGFLPLSGHSTAPADFHRMSSYIRAVPAKKSAGTGAAHFSPIGSFPQTNCNKDTRKRGKEMKRKRLNLMIVKLVKNEKWLF